MKKRLIVIGAGPKAMAVVSKTTALRNMRYLTPEVTVIEQFHPGANWSGKNGHTCGNHFLGTPPSKDVGFPYFSNFSPEVNKLMIGEFSWQAYLSGGNTNWMKYGDWVDRGMPHPPHKVWCGYLNWIREKTELNGSVNFITGEVVKLYSKNGVWIVTYKDSGKNEKTLEAEGIAITGPGKLREIEGQPVHARVLNGKSFWLNKEVFSGITADDLDGPICVIGAGETAASIVSELGSLLNSSNPPAIHLINEQGLIFSRGENYFENSIYTDSDSLNWSELSIEQRRMIINRTDRGVFSIDSLKTINQMTNLAIIKGRTSKIVIDKPEDTPRLIVSDRDSSRKVEIPAAYIIVSIGYDPWSFLDLMSDELKAKFEANSEKVVNTIERDLSVDWTSLDSSFATVFPKLHLPMLSGIAQGPGFPNLSCLGALSDRILSSYM